MPQRERVSVVLAGGDGMAIVWRDPMTRTAGQGSATGLVPVWDGAGVEIPAHCFVPLSSLLEALVEWVTDGTLSESLEWTTEDYGP